MKEWINKVISLFCGRGKRIALVIGAVFIFTLGLVLSGSGGGLGDKLSASLSGAWSFTKDSFSRTPVAEFDLATLQDNNRAEVSGAAYSEAKKVCDVEADTAADGSIVFSEIAWMGTKESYRSEWIEFQNRSDAEIKLAGWTLADDGGKLSVSFPESAVIAPHGFFTVVKKGYASADKKEGAEFTGTIRNSDQTLKIFDPDCVPRDAAVADPSWPAGNNDTKQTMERDVKTLVWHTSAKDGGTPGRYNSNGVTPETAEPKSGIKSSEAVKKISISSPTISAAVEPAEEPIAAICPKRDDAVPTHALVINEVAWAGTASDKTSHEWIELKNITMQPLSLKGWQIMNRAQTLRFVFPDSELAAGDLILLERTDDETLTAVDADFIYSGALKNSDETLRLFSSACALSDEVNADIGTGKTWPAGTAAPEYRSMERAADFSWNTFQGSSTAGVFGTPKKTNTSFASGTPTYSDRAVLTLVKTGMGSGVITSAPTGIQCGSVCSYSFQKNSDILLTATPDAGSQFGGWNGCVGFGACSMVLSGNMEIMAEFRGVSAPFPVVPPAPVPVPASGLSHLVITEVQVAGSGASDEYMAIFNPTDTAVSLSGWSVQYRGPSASVFNKKNFESTHTIASGAVFIIANPQYTGALPVNMTHSSFTLGGSGGSIFLVSTTTLLTSGTEGAITDKVAYGSGANLFPEGAAYPDAPAASQVLSRKNSGGAYQDTDDNALDFEIK